MSFLRCVFPAVLCIKITVYIFSYISVSPHHDADFLKFCMCQKYAMCNWSIRAVIKQLFGASMSSGEGRRRGEKQSDCLKPLKYHPYNSDDEI